MNTPTEQHPPRIGAPWPGQGGIYAGIARGRDGAPDCHLIVGPEIVGRVDWPTATQKAAEIEVDGHRDFSLPFRAEQSLLFANTPELFQADWYWSCEQHASGSACAWMQDFAYGDQNYASKDGTDRARAVRRVEILSTPA